MKKALIISLGSRSTIENYGAVLQITAFCALLRERYGIQSKVLDYIGINCKGCSDSLFFWEIIYGNGLRGRIKSIFLGGKIKKRIKNNLVFLRNECGNTRLYDYSTINNASFRYDYYIAVSDVIWDPSFRKGGFDNVFFLPDYVFKRGKRIVFSAGIGDGVFNEEEKEDFKNKIAKLDRWSVREGYASEYLKEFIHSHVRVTLDPTLIVDDLFYKKYINTKKRNKKRYILLYDVGYNNQKMLQDESDYAKQFDYELIRISRTSNVYEKVYPLINVTIPDFLTMLYYCEAFFCNSFHGVCLAIRFKKTFFVYERPNGKKITDICNRLNLENRIVSKNIMEFENLIKPINFEDVYSKLDKEKKNTLDFLDKALGMEEPVKRRQ